MSVKEQIEDFIQFTKGSLPEYVPYQLAQMGYFTLPASIRHHGQKKGDLYLHSKMVAMALKEFTEAMHLTWQQERSPMIIGLLHDLCKTDDYMMEGEQAIRNPERLPGHGEKSVTFAKELLEGLTEEELMCIRYHCGAYEGKEAWKELGEAIKKYPNILWVHHADMVASHIWKI